MSDQNQQLKPESKSSTEINVNFKGQISFCVKVYDDNPVLATNECVKIVEKLKEKFKKEFTF